MKVICGLAAVATAWAVFSAEAMAAPKRNGYIEPNARFYDRPVKQLAGPKASKAATYFAYLRISGT